MGILQLLARRRLVPVLLIADRQRGLRVRLTTIPQTYPHIPNYPIPLTKSGAVVSVPKTYKLL
jgi:hypothetical protein